MPTSTLSGRAQRAAVRYDHYINCSPEYDHQAQDAWLEFATPGEVRRLWESWMGPLPGWAALEYRLGEDAGVDPVIRARNLRRAVKIARKRMAASPLLASGLITAVEVPLYRDGREVARVRAEAPAPTR